VAEEDRMNWAFFIARRPPSLNERIQNNRAGNWKYKREREAWCAAVRAARDDHAIPKATGPRWLIVRRQYKGREQERDYINLVGGCKALVDALVLEGLLVDDKPSLLVDCYEQERVGKEQQSGVWFELGDVTAAAADVDPAQNRATEPAAGVTAPTSRRARAVAKRALSAVQRVRGGAI
jgi:hypothetical protein